MGKLLYPFLTPFLGGILCLFMGVSGFSQLNDKTRDTGSLKFDVVSIRPSSGARPQGVRILPDGYEAIGLPLESTIYIAYVPSPFYKHLDDMKGFPSWAIDDKYDIIAKVDPADATRWRNLGAHPMQTSTTLQHMLRLVLAERCKLRVRSVDTTGTGYALHLINQSTPLVADSALPVGDQGLPLLNGARAVVSMKNGDQVYTFYNTSMPTLATYLTITSQRTIEDRTGLRGRYKFELRHITYTAPNDDSEPQVDMLMPWDLHAIGMRLDKEKVKRTLWSIDNIEKPSPN